MIRVALPICLMLSSCSGGSASDAITDFLGTSPKVVGNEVSVQVTNVRSQSDGFPLAEKHCRQYGRAARFSADVSRYSATFDCVKVE